MHRMRSLQDHEYIRYLQVAPKSVVMYSRVPAPNALRLIAQDLSDLNKPCGDPKLATGRPQRDRQSRLDA